MKKYDVACTYAGDGQLHFKLTSNSW